jgi:hypothetical protein
VNTRTAKRGKNPALANRYSVEQKERALASFEAARAAGETAAEAASRIGLPLSTIRRWQDQKELDGINAAVSAAEDRVDNAIAVLSKAPLHDDDAVRDAMFDFWAWVRWPQYIGAHSALAMHLHAGYLSGDPTIETLADLAAARALGHFRPQDILGVAAMTIQLPAFYEYGQLDDNPRHTLEEFLAELGHYFIDAPASASPSIRQAFFLQRKGAFGPITHGSSERTFRSRWQELAPTIPFRYVESFHSDISWNVKPIDPQFREQVDELVAARGELANFFAASKEATARFVARLDPRAAAAIDFRNFPDDVPVRALPKQDWSARIIKAVVLPDVE